MDRFLIEQALFLQSYEHPADGTEAAATIVPLGRSPGFIDDWTAFAEELIHGFGDRRARVRCPLAVFAHTFGDKHVAVVQVADQPNNLLAFHFLVLLRGDYEKCLGDPFYLAQKLPAGWLQRGSLPTHSWPRVPPPGRTIAEVRKVLQRLKTGALSEDWEPPASTDAAEVTLSGQTTLGAGGPPASVAGEPPAPREPTEAITKTKSKPAPRTAENSESPALLGATQVLVDGGRVFFRRPAPDMNLISGLWTLLPTSTRSRLWPASFAFSNHLQFDAVVVPRLDENDLEGYTSEEQAIDYPEGTFELALQTAAETGDQQHLDELMARRSVWDTWRLGLYLLALMIGLVAVSNWIPKAQPPTPGEVQRRAMAAASVVGVAANDPWIAMAILHAGKQKIHKIGD
jgi:hypothetical protein